MFWSSKKCHCIPIIKLFIKMILLMCALRAPNSIPILEKVFSGIEKVVNTFSKPQILIMLLTQYFYNNFTINSKHKDKLLVVDSNKNK